MHRPFDGVALVMRGGTRRPSPKKSVVFLGPFPHAVATVRLLARS
jgi:hypothetical protein